MIYRIARSILRYASVALIVPFIPTSAEAKLKVVPEPANRPDWTLVRERSETTLRNSLYDPSSAQITWTSGFQWGYVKPLLGPHYWGWVGCVMLNAKNRFGGYVGARAYWVEYGADRSIMFGDAGIWRSQCDQPHQVAIQPELIVSSPASESHEGSVVDELTKLAKLRDQGVLTEAEFETEKAKLLAQ